MGYCQKRRQKCVCVCVHIHFSFNCEWLCNVHSRGEQWGSNTQAAYITKSDTDVQQEPTSRQRKKHTLVIQHKKDESWHSLGMKEQNKYKEYVSRLSNNRKRNKKVKITSIYMSKRCILSPLVRQPHLPGRCTLQAKELGKGVNNR